MFSVKENSSTDTFEVVVIKSKGSKMRLIAIALAAFIASGPAAAQAIEPPWRLYPEVTDGFLLTFPGEPDIEFTKWDLVPRRPADATVYSVRYDGGLYKMTVVDATDTFIKEDPIVARAIARISEGGELRENEPTRVYQIYGRTLSVARPDGTTTLAAVFYASERLYMLEASGPDSTSSDRFRFLRSLSFDRNVKNRTKEQLDAYWAACTRGANGGQLPLLPSGLDDPRCARD
jgi:hypothetical protein